MKTTHNEFLTKEDREKRVSVGKSFTPGPTYSKEDYLTPGKVAQKFGISIEKAKEMMKKLIMRRATFALNGHKAPIITNLGKKDGKSMYLHPMGLVAFKQKLEQQKD